MRRAIEFDDAIGDPGPHVVDHDLVHRVLADGDRARAAEAVATVQAMARVHAVLDGQRRALERDVRARQLRIDESPQFGGGAFDRATDGEVGGNVDAGRCQILGLGRRGCLLQGLLRFGGGELALLGAASEHEGKWQSDQVQSAVHGPLRCSRHASFIRPQSSSF